MSRILLSSAMAAVLLAVVGCGRPAYTFDVTVKNATDRPLAVGLVKNGPPLEVGWDSPEQIAIGAPELGSKKWGTLVPAGQTARLKPTKGSFEPDVAAFLRVYDGDHTINELLAIGRDSASRLDVPLDSEKSTVTILTRNGRLAAEKQTTSP